MCLLCLCAAVAFSCTLKSDESNESELKELIISKSSLVDPFSVEFRNVVYDFNDLSILHPDTSIKDWCGELNAKNKMGAYAGWSRFVATHAIIFDEEKPKDNMKTIKSVYIESDRDDFNTKMLKIKWEASKCDNN